jgi:hypothetical protein
MVYMSLVLVGTGLQAEEALRVLDRGLDGNKRNYLITCPDGKYSSVVEEFTIQELPDGLGQQDNPRLTGAVNVAPAKLLQVCVYPHDGLDLCRPVWSVDEAAKESCQ